MKRERLERLTKSLEDYLNESSKMLRIFTFIPKKSN